MAVAFPSLGKHCRVKGCGILDFLPFQCALCEQHFCLEHRTESAHSCTSQRKEPSSASCPLCNRLLAVGIHEVASDVVTAHIENGCPPLDSGNIHKCSMKRCKKRELVPFQCKSCKLNFCVSHRLTMDHNCERTKVSPLVPKPSSAKPSSVAATCRQELAASASSSASFSVSSSSSSSSSSGWSSRTNVGLSRLLTSGPSASNSASAHQADDSSLARNQCISCH